MFLRLLAVRLNAEKARRQHLVINWTLTDIDEPVPPEPGKRDPSHTGLGSLAENPMPAQHDSPVTLDRILCAN